MKQLSITSIIVAIIGILTTLFTLSACTVKVQRTDQPTPQVAVEPFQEVEPFSSLLIDLPLKVVYHVSDSIRAIRLEGEEAKVDLVNIQFYDGELRLYRKYHSGRTLDMHFGAPLNVEGVVAHITGPALQELTIYSSGIFECAEQMHVKEAFYNLHGFCRLTLRNLVAEEYVQLYAGGASKIEVARLQAPHTDLELHGTSKVNVCFNAPDGKASCKAEGAGEIILSGRLGALELPTSSSSEIKHDELTITH